MRCRKKNKPSIRIPFPEEMTIWMDVWFDFFWPLLANEVGVGQPAISNMMGAVRRDRCAVRCGGLMCQAHCCCLQGVTSAFCSYPRGVALTPSTMTAYFKVGQAVAGGSCHAMQLPVPHSLRMPVPPAGLDQHVPQEGQARFHHR